MICRWPICSNPQLLTAFVLVLCEGAYGATVSGRFQITDSRLAAITKSKNYSGIVVWLEPVPGKTGAANPRTHTILQKGKKFSPHISVVPVGTLVDFPNLDPIFHNAFSNFAGQPFDTGLYPPGTNYKVRFSRPGVVRIFCNIHSTMSAVIVVVGSPWFTNTGIDGAFSIPDVPPGEYVLKVFHERAGEGSLRAIEKRITVADLALTLPLASISESGFVDAGHKNKYGKDYGPEPPDRVPYGGKR